MVAILIECGTTTSLSQGSVSEEAQSGKGAIPQWLR